MRLGQLARSVELKPKELIELLDEKGREGYTHANSKMSPEDEAFVLDYFGISIEEKELDDSEHKQVNEAVEESLEKIEAEELVAEPSIPNDKFEEESDSTVESINESEALTTDNESEEVSTQEEVEVIKAPKIELPGLKVVGKIELPEPPIKEEKESEAKDTEKAEPRDRKERQRDRSNKRNRGRAHDPDYNPIKAKREREKKRQERNRQLQKEKEKQKKKEYYLEKVATQAAKPTSKTKPNTPASYSQVVLESEIKNSDTNPQNRNIFARLWRWLNTY